MRRGAPRAFASVASSNTARAAARGAVRLRHVPSCSSVGRFELVPWLLGPVQRHEESLHIPVEAAFAHLIGFGLDEGVVAAFGAGADAHRAERPAEGPRPRRSALLAQPDSWEEIVGAIEDARRR